MYRPYNLGGGQRAMPSFERADQRTIRSDNEVLAERAINQSFSAPVPNVYGPCTLDVGQNVNPNLENEVFPRQGNFQNDEVPNATDEPDDNVYNLLAVAANLANVNLQK
ncbi:hypothetical protein CDAR_386721 [Caerostris darwini]|uniref:Uncharacterized protein n=1 Tax=Caerostris darwini TaxID=1538125 RepID=A0AAV4UEH3_9ARAC|nr:hypothetical protein CDAR_386721 [Caerostris darwini]